MLMTFSILHKRLRSVLIPNGADMGIAPFFCTKLAIDLIHARQNVFGWNLPLYRPAITVWSQLPTSVTRPQNCRRFYSSSGRSEGNCVRLGLDS